jgi:hypothetical protein
VADTGVFPFVSSASAISSSWPPAPALLCRRGRFDCTNGFFEAVEELAVWDAAAFGGPGAIGTTPAFDAAEAVAALFAVGTAVLLPVTLPLLDFGDSESAPLAFADVGVVTGVCAIEFFRDVFFELRPVEPAGGPEVPDPRFLFLMTSVFNDRGLTTPCNFRNRPHALHKGWPSGFRLHNGVVWVKQFVHVVGAPFGSPCFVPPGLLGRLGAADEKLDSGGEEGELCGRASIPDAVCTSPAVLGVELVRGIFWRRGSWLRFRKSLTEAAEP